MVTLGKGRKWKVVQAPINESWPKGSKLSLFHNAGGIVQSQSKSQEALTITQFVYG